MNSNPTISLSDQELLTQYVTQHSERAFEALIRRHGKMVYSVALRKVRQPVIAEDVTQAVFLVLVHKSASLLNVRSLGGWLHRVTRFAAIDALRREDARVDYERRAALVRADACEGLESTIPEEDPGTAAIDEALARLNAVDRDALLLRFYQDATYSEIGIALSMSEDAVRVRISRALAGLKKMLTHRTGKDSAGAAAMVTLAMFLSRSISSAPAAMIDRIALNSGPMSAGQVGGTTASIAQAVLRRMQLYYVKFAAAVAAGIVLIISVLAMLAMTTRNGAGRSVALQNEAAPYANMDGQAGAESLNTPITSGLPGQDPGKGWNSISPNLAGSPDGAGSGVNPSSPNAPADATSVPAPTADVTAPVTQNAANKDVIHIRMVKVPGEQWVGYVFQRQTEGSGAPSDTAAYELVKINLHGIASGPKWMLNIGSVVRVKKEKPVQNLMRILASLRR
jgi:RNA polymerase sigma factor (sigma-70 family)